MVSSDPDNMHQLLHSSRRKELNLTRYVLSDLGNVRNVDWGVGIVIDQTDSRALVTLY